MTYRVQAKRGQDPTSHWQVTKSTHMMGMGGRPMPTNISGLQQPFPFSHDWRTRAGVGPFPGPRASTARDIDSYGSYNQGSF